MPDAEHGLRKLLLNVHGPAYAKKPALPGNIFDFEIVVGRRDSPSQRQSALSSALVHYSRLAPASDTKIIFRTAVTSSPSRPDPLNDSLTSPTRTVTLRAMLTLDEIRTALRQVRHDHNAFAPHASQAAVTMILADGAQGIEVCFIRRAERVGDPGSGHVAFPGGRANISDADRCLRGCRA